MCGFTHAQLHVSSNVQPEVVVSTPSLVAILDVALDARGDVWVVGSGSDDVFRFPATSLEKAGSVQPDLEITSAALRSPGSLAFDGSGGLWVASRQFSTAGSNYDGAILRFDVPSGASGIQRLAPVAIVTSAKSSDLFQLGSIGFDGAQNLWATSFAGLVRFDDPRAQAGGAVLTPGAVIDKTGYPNDLYFYSVAFDAAGDLWAASGDGLHHLTSVTEFVDPASFHGRSSPTPAGTILGGVDIIPAGGLAFDGAGNLWMATGESILMYPNPGRLAGTANPNPAITLGLVGPSSPTTNTHLVFFPAPAGSEPVPPADGGASNAADGTTDADDGSDESGDDADAPDDSEALGHLGAAGDPPSPGEH